MTELSDQLINQHLAAETDRQLAYLCEPRYHAELHQLGAMLDVVDTALTGAGHAPEKRQEILRVLLAGAPDPSAARERLDEQATRTAELAARPMNHTEINRRWDAYGRSEYDSHPALAGPAARGGRANLTILTSGPALTPLATGGADLTPGL